MCEKGTKDLDLKWNLSKWKNEKKATTTKQKHFRK